MRLLKNIYNEFVIYFNRLNITELDCNKMLAIIAYKNLFPRDFADLQLNQGFVYTLFNSKERFIAEETKKLNDWISEKKHQIDMAENEHFRTIQEITTFFDTKRPLDYYGRKKSLSDEDQIEFTNRKKALENKLNNKIPQIENEIGIIEHELVLLKNKQLKDIITRENINTIFSVTSTNEIGHITDFNEIKSSEYFDLLKYLIRNGYIDETYADYMSYFYENSLSRIDKIFLRSITDRKSKEYTYQLKNPKLVISRLRLVDFDQEEILNFDLLTYLLQTESHIKYLEKFFNQLIETRNFKFIGAYFDVTTEIPSYIKYLNIRWPEIFKTILEEKSLPEKQIRKYSIFSIYYSGDDTIKLINQDNCLCDYISNSRDYLAINNPQIERLIHCFTLLGVCFITFDYAELNKDLFYTVYKKSLYKINAENLRLIQTEILGEKNDVDIVHKNYTVLLSHPDSAITKYVNQNINEYFSCVLQMSGGTILDEENVAVTVLNNSELTIEHKQSYISALGTIITSIKEIMNSSLWASLLDANIVQYSECNIMDCFNVIKLNESVISYINRCDIDLDFSKTEYDEDVKEKLFDSVIICNDINNSKYKQILVSLNFTYNKFDIAEISDDKITILIDTDIISMTPNTLKFMRDNYLNRKVYFIRKNIEKYIDIMDDALFLQEELLEILTWDISDELKIKLLEFSDDEISVIGKSYSPVVCLYILNNNFSKSDLPDLFSSFDQWDNSIQVKIFDFAEKNIACIIDNRSFVSERLKMNLFHSERVNRAEKIDLLIAILPELCEDSIKEILSLLNLTDYLKIFESRSRPKFEINNENEKLLTAFKENKLIDDYQENPEKEGYFKIIRAKSLTKT